MSGSQTPGVPDTLRIIVLVETPGGTPIEGAKVKVVEPPLAENEKTTQADGIVVFEVTDKQFREGSADPTKDMILVTIEARKRHHSPIQTTESKADVGPAIMRGTMARGRQGVATDDAEVDAKNRIHMLLVDGGSLGGRFDLDFPELGQPAIPTRRLNDDQIQKELLFHVANGALVLSKSSEMKITHDPNLGDQENCGPGCKIDSPEPDRAINLRVAELAGVKVLTLLTTVGRDKQAAHTFSKRKSDEKPGDEYARDTFAWNNTQINRIDQRHAVALGRFGRRLQGLGFTIFYTTGISGDTRPDAHGWGRAVDVAGFAKTHPDKANRAKRETIRPGNDFLVFLHWGRVPMFDPATATDIAQQDKWKRFTGKFDDGRNYADPGKGPLRYRLDPPPFQESEVMGPHFVEARDLFSNIYEFLVAEYTDTDSRLPAQDDGTDPTPIDDPKSHFVLHPDMGRPDTITTNDAGEKVQVKDGRQSHINHYHAQFGKKFPINRETPRPR